MAQVADQKNTTPAGQSESLLASMLRNVRKFLFATKATPDQQLYTSISTCLIILAGIVIILKMYDDSFGYINSIKTKLKVLRNAGMSSLNYLKSPMSPSQLETYFARMRDAGNLSDLEMHSLHTAVIARKAHDAFFEPKLFQSNPAETAMHMATWAFIMAVGSVLMMIAPIFGAFYLLWFIIKYFSYLVKAVAGYWLEVVFKFVIDTIAATVKKVVAEVVNNIVKVLTFGAKKQSISVKMPVFSEYVAKWWKKYVNPLLKNIDDEYGCRIDTGKRKLAKTLGWILLPVKQMYIWYAEIKRYGVDLPFDQFRSIVMEKYPKFVQRNANYADDLTMLDAKFYEYLKRRTTEDHLHKKRGYPLQKSSGVVQSDKFSSPVKSLDFRTSDAPQTLQQSVCEIIK